MQPTLAAMKLVENILNDYVALQYAPGNSKRIEVFCSYSDLKRMFKRVRDQWESVGGREPYASVLSDPKYRMENIDSSLKEFIETGRSTINKVKQLSEKNGSPLPSGSMLELGCGVGRVTQWFAELFETTHAWDVSEGNLAECKKNLMRKSVNNVNLRLINGIADYADLPTFDFFFSEIVLQHNPPPIQYYILDKVLQKINLEGLVCFQTVTHHQSYQFDVKSYFSWQHDRDFEMHVLPMRWVYTLFRKHGVALTDVVRDNLGGGGLVSNTFFGKKIL